MVTDEFPRLREKKSTLKSYIKYFLSQRSVRKIITEWKIRENKNKFPLQ